MVEWEESVQVPSDMCEKENEEDEVTNVQLKEQVTSLGVLGNDNHSVAKKYSVHVVMMQATGWKRMR